MHCRSSTFSNRPREKFKNRAGPPRSSSPAALGCEGHSEKDDPEPHVTAERTRLDEAPDPSTSEQDDVVTDDVIKVEIPRTVQTTSSFVKGHQKTSSLPPPASDVVLKGGQVYAKEDDVRQGRCQSASEAPTSVKQIVTAIESLQSPEVEGRSSNEGMKRSASMPTRKKNGGPTFPSNLFATAERILESEADYVLRNPAPESSFYIGTGDDEEEPVRNFPSDLNANNNNNNCHCAASPDVSSSFQTQKPADFSEEERHRMSPEVLHVIREVRGEKTVSENILNE